MEFIDKNGNEVYVGATVDVPSPTTEDLWNFEFEGTIVKLDKENGYVIVEDGDGDCWAIEVERVEVI
jgi:hypothetical protein